MNQTIPGDLVLFDTKGVVPWLIRFGQRLRWRGPRKVFAHWNHVAILVDVQGTLIEAQADGVRYGRLNPLGTNYRVVDIAATDEDRLQVVDYVKARVDHTGYGFVAFVCIASNMIFNTRLRVSWDRTEICSALAAEAVERAGVVWPVEPQFVTPAGIAEKFNVR